MSVFDCPVCGSANVFVFAEIQSVPAHCNLLCKTREQALATARVTIQLAACKDCTHIFNGAFRPDLIDYGGDYENSLDCSPTFQSYGNNLVTTLIDRYGLRGKRVLEIGCGKGEFLKMLCHLGGNQGIGFDPGAPDNTDTPVTFMRDFYCEKYSDLSADFVCCRHALEHMERPLAFLAMLRRAFGDSLDTILFFEVPNALFTIRELGIWDIIHEHYSYFTEDSLARLFARCGFDVLEVTGTYGGQFLTILAKPSGSRRVGLEAANHCDIAKEVDCFGGVYRTHVEHWRRWLEDVSCRRVVVWGAGSKGVTFLNVLQPDGRVDCVADLNPRKTDMYVPGTGHRIVPPVALAERKPAVVIIMNRIYEQEIRDTLREMDLSPELLMA